MVQEAKKSHWALDAFLINKLHIFPGSIKNNSLDNLFQEEKLFLFYLDAYWGRISNEMQVVHVYESEIDEIIKEDSVPEGIKRVTDRMIQNATTEEQKASLRKTMQVTEAQRKIQKIENVFEKLGELISSEDIAKMKIKINEKLREKGKKK